LINERPLESNPYLKMRGESQVRAKHAFERRAGWRFGLIFGVLLLVMGYAWDAAQLARFHTEFWWLKFALAAVTILPLAILTGGISGYMNWLLKLPLWAIFGIIAGWCAIHIPFDGMRIALQPFDANLRIVEYLPVPEAAAESNGMLGTLGASVGLLVGLAQTFLVNSAWERSTSDYRITLSGLALFLLTIPFAFAYAFLYDGTAHVPLRMPLERIHSIVQSGLNDPPNLDSSGVEADRALNYLTGQRWRKQFTADYTMHVASVEPTRLGQSYVDVSFTNGFNWRCRLTSIGEFAIGCNDLNTDYARYITEFVPRGSFRCEDCEARVTAQAAEWRAQNARPLTTTDKISATHGAGSSVNVRVLSQHQNSFECLIWGANPVIVEQCK
jgi:hypothetical protein